jgi:hypothetical protein
MIRTATTHRLATLATGGLMLALSLAGPSAKAQTQTCMSGLPISTIVATGLTGYTCQLGTITYTFASDIAELNMPNNNGTLNFSHTPTSQEIIFSNLEFQGLAEFSYTAISTTDTMTSILQTFTQNPSTPSPIESNVFATVPSTVVSVTAVLETDMSPPPGLRPKLTSLTHSISMVPVPGPLPIMGTALALGVSRKLRQRIQQADSLEHHSSRS